MSSFRCPFCNSVMPIIKETHRSRRLDFSSLEYEAKVPFLATDFSSAIDIYKCPECERQTIIIQGLSPSSPIGRVQVYPRSSATQFPDYIPQQIRSDYEEACAIVDLSPKASATLSRRCLQGMIRDFWNISGKRRLIDEIYALNDLIPTDQWAVIDGVRRIGNIGAHMEQDVNLIIDVDPGEAQKLIKLIELLMRDWYIVRHDREKLYSDILAIDAAKQSERESNA